MAKAKKKRESVKLRQKLTVHNQIHRALENEPVTIGVPWPEGKLKDENKVVVLEEDGRRIPAGVTVLNRWKDGSIQWTLLDFVTTLEKSGYCSQTKVCNYREGTGRQTKVCNYGEGTGRQTKVCNYGDELGTKTFIVDASGLKKECAYQNSIKVAEDADGVNVSNGVLEIRVSKKRGSMIDYFKVNGKDVIRDGQFDILIENSDGKEFNLRNSEKIVSFEYCNPVKTVVRIDGFHTAGDGSIFINYWLKLTIYAGRKDVIFTYHFRNREKEEPGVKIKRISAWFNPVMEENTTKHITHINRSRFYWCSFYKTPKDMEIITSDVVDVNKYVEQHKDTTAPKCIVRDASVLDDPDDDKPWFMKNIEFRGGGGERAVMPYVGLKDNKSTILVFIKEMSQMYPKGIRVASDNVRMDFLPEWAGLMDVTQGAGRTMEFVIAGLGTDADDMEIQTNYLHHEGYSGTSTLRIEPDVKWIRKCKVFYIDRIPEYDPVGHFRFERKIGHAWFGVGYGQRGNAGSQPMSGTGMWHYGDPVSPGYTTNNEEMAGHPLLHDYLRSGRWENALAGITRAQHSIDVDYVDYSNDKYQHYGMVAHCTNHNNGSVYPSHVWFTELFMAYAITGNPEFKRAGLNMCENLLFWIDDAMGMKIIADDEREAGQPIINLMWAYEWNRDERYIDSCMKIVKDVYLTADKLFGRMIDAKPNREMPISLQLYGDYATYEGLYYLWEITRDKELGKFIVRQCDWRVTDEQTGTKGWFRTTDINPGAFAYYITGDKKYLKRIEKSIKALFSASVWEIGWVKSMYVLKIAFDMGMVRDEDIVL